MSEHDTINRTGRLEQLRYAEACRRDERERAYESVRPVELAHREARTALLLEAARALLTGTDCESIFRAAGVDWESLTASAAFTHEIGQAVEAWIIQRHPYVAPQLSEGG